MNKGDNYNKNNILINILLYLKNIAISILIALIITICLLFNTRQHVINNFNNSYVNNLKFNKHFAKELLQNSELNINFQQQSFSTCMYFASLYYTIEQYDNAKNIYSIAMLKSKPNNYQAHLKYVEILILQNKLNEAKEFIENIPDNNNKNLIKMKSNSYLLLGDALFAQKKYLTAARYYKKSKFYYDLFKKRKKTIEEKLINDISNSYNKVADILVENNYPKEAIEYLKKARKIKPNDFITEYKLAILYSDLDPLKSLEYFEQLIKQKPQEIDSNIYIKALMHSANIESLSGNEIKAKLYRYKIYSFEELLKHKVVYKNDFDIIFQNINYSKKFFKYRINTIIRIQNHSLSNINKLYVELILKKDDKILDKITKECISNKKILQADGDLTPPIEITFNKNFLTKTDLSKLEIDIYLYKDEKYKTLIKTKTVPIKKSILEVSDTY